MALGQIALPTLVQKITLDATDVDKNVGGAESRLASFSSKAQAVGGTMTKFVTLPIAAAGVASFKMASDLNESVSKVGVVFDKNAGQIMAWSKTAATSLGMSQQQALEAAGTFGNLFRAMGLSTDAAASMSPKIVGLASDLASFNNANPQEVLDALRAGLVGETEPLRRFGININQARIEAEAFALGLVQPVKNAPLIQAAHLKVEAATRKLAEAQKTYGKDSLEARTAANELEIAQGKLNEATAGAVPELNAAQKAQASYSLIMKDSALAQGDFARTSDGAANQQRIMAAQFKDTAAALGQTLLPLGTQLLGWVNNLMMSFRNLSPETQKIIVYIGGFAAAMGPALIMAGKMATGVKALHDGFKVLKGLEVGTKIANAMFTAAGGVDKLMMGVKALFGLVMAHPFIAIGVAVVALFILLYTKVDWFRNAVNAAFSWIASTGVAIWEGIKGAAVAVWDAIGAAVSWVWTGVLQPIWGAIQVALGALGTAFGVIASVVTTVWNAIASVISTVWAVVQVIFSAYVTVISTVLIVWFNTLRTIVTIVWFAIQTAISAAWAFIQPIWAAIVAFIQAVLVTTFNFLSSVVSAVWNAIASVIQWAWSSVLQPVWQAIIGFVQGPLASVFNFFQGVFSGVWNAVVGIAQSTWGAISGVWNGLKSFVEGTLIPIWDRVRGAFETAWRTIGSVASSVWDGIKGAFTGGLAVIGGVVGGILDLVGKIASAVGAKDLAGDLAGWAASARSWGQATGGTVPTTPRSFAKGGMMPYLEVGGGFVTPGARAIVGEGRQGFPEYVIPTDPQYRDRAWMLTTSLLDKLGAEGGRPGMTPAHGIGDVIGGVTDWLRDGVAAGVSKVWPVLPMKRTMPWDIPAGGANSLRQAAIDFIKGEAEKYAPPLSGGIGWEAMWNAVKTRFPDAALHSAYRPGAITATGNASYHGMGRAIDISPRSDIAEWIRANYMAATREMIFSPMGSRQIHNGSDHYYTGVTRDMHWDHVHWAMKMGGLLSNFAQSFDSGGWLKPGWTMAWNGTGQPEQVLAKGGRIRPGSREERAAFNPPGPGKEYHAFGAWRLQNAMMAGQENVAGGINWNSQGRYGGGGSSWDGGLGDRWGRVNLGGRGGETLVISEGALQLPIVVGDHVSRDDLEKVRATVSDAFDRFERTTRQKRRKR